MRHQLSDLLTKAEIVEIETESAAYTVLHSILTQVALTKKSYKTKLKISYADLMKGIGDTDTYADADLQVEIKCVWVAPSIEDEEVVIEEDETGGEAYE